MTRGMSKFAAAAAVAAGALAAGSAPASEITGNGKTLVIHGRSDCAYSGLNDCDGDPRDPGYNCNPNRGRDLHDD